MSLYDVLKGVSDALLVGDEVAIDHFVFKLHSLYSVTLLVAFSVLLSLSQYVGDPIDCIHSSGIPDGIFDTYCWVQGTFTKRLTNGGKLDQAGCQAGDPDCLHHKYYQWVALVLLCQAALFYLPRYLWLIWEEGKVKSLISGLDKKTLIRGLQTEESLSSGKVNTDIKELVANWKDIRGTNNIWASKFYLCEVLNLAIVIGQIKFTDFFLNGQFYRVGLEGLHLEENDSVLPITASCSFNYTGAGGKVSSFTGLCVLPLNMVNQKFYTVFWIWLHALLVVNSMLLFFRLALIMSPQMRDFVLRYIYNLKNIKWTIVAKSSHGDWLLLTFLLRNMHFLINSHFVDELAKLKHYDHDL